MGGVTDPSDLVARLEAIAEELADRAIAVLREAVAAGATARPEEERRLTRARRAVEKAASILSSPSGSSDTGPG
jgi:hypothetical protein